MRYMVALPPSHLVPGTRGAAAAVRATVRVLIGCDSANEA